MAEFRRILILLAVSGAMGLIWYFLFFADEGDGLGYVYWNGTVTFIWSDASAKERDYGVGRGRYEVRLLNGAHVETRTNLRENFNMFDCVTVRQRLKVISYEPTYEIVSRADSCWTP